MAETFKGIVLDTSELKLWATREAIDDWQRFKAIEKEKRRLERERRRERIRGKRPPPTPTFCDWRREGF